MPNIERKLPKVTALAAPLLFVFAHSACTDQKYAPPQVPSTSGQNTAIPQTTFAEQFSEGNLPTEPITKPATPNPEIIPTNVVKQPLLNSRFQIVDLPDEAQIQITETTPTEVLTYKLYAPEFNSLDSLTSGIFKILDNHIPYNTYLRIQKLLEGAKNVHETQAVVMVNSAAKLLQNACNPNKPDSIINFNMKRLASYVFFTTDRETFIDNEQVYFGNCFWGEKFIVSQEHEIINLEGGIILYKNITYDDLLNEKNLAPLRAVLTQPQTLDERVIQPLKGAQKIDAQNPNDPQLHNYFHVVVNSLQSICSKKAQGKKYMRLVASFLYDKHPQEWEYVKGFSMISCLATN